MTSTAAISVCVLANDDAAALQLTLDAAAGLGTLVVGVPEGSVAPLPHTGATTVPIALTESVGAAWDRVLRGAPDDHCLLLHPGEVIVAGHPAVDAPFSSCTVIDHPDPFALPDRLDAVRLVDRSRCRVRGHVRPVLAADGPTGEGHGTIVVVDAGSAPGPAHQAWLQHLGVALDATDDPAELVDLAALLAGTGELDAATVRLMQLLGAIHGDLGRRAARLLTFCAVRRSRRIEAELGAREWERLDDQRGPAMALRGVALASKLRVGHAVPLLEGALAAGLVDRDGIVVDRAWIETVLSDAKVRLPLLEPVVVAEIQALRTKPKIWNLCDGWLQLGRPLSDLASSLTGDVRRRFVTGVVDHARAIDASGCLDMAEWLAEKGITQQVLTLVHLVTVRGELPFDDGVAWSERLRAAGKGQECPLPLLAVSPAAPPVTRVRAAAALVDRFADPRGIAVLREAAAAVHPAALGGILHRLSDEAPTALVSFIEAAGRTKERRAALADTLEAGSAQGLAEQLRAV